MANDSGPKPQREIAKLKSKVKRLQRERDKSFPELGKAAYQAFLGGRVSDPALSENADRIRNLDVEIENAQAEIARLQALVQQLKSAPAIVGACASCGAPVTAGLKFCGSCGAALTPLAQTGSACVSCGAAVAPGARFCGECGTPFQAPEPAAAPAVAPEPQQSPGATVSPPPPPPGPEPDPQGATEDSSSPRCPACGAVVEETGAAFCGECGTRL